MTETGKMVYMSRALLPGFKGEENAPTKYAKQVCVYGFDKSSCVSTANLDAKV